MIISENHPSEEMNISQQVASAVVLLNIHARKISMESRIQPSLAEPVTSFTASFKQYPAQVELREGDRLLDVHIGIDVFFFAVDPTSGEKGAKVPDPEKWKVRIELMFVLTYGLPKAPIPEDIRKAGLAAFGRINARLACWPYIRHQANHLASEVGIPFVMPTLLLRKDPGEQEAVKDQPAP